MYWTVALLLAALCFFRGTYAETFYGGLVNEEVTRTINLANHVVTELIELRVRNTGGKSSIDTYVLPLSQRNFEHLSYASLEFSIVDLDIKGAPANTTYLSFQLSKPFTETGRFRIELAYVGIVEPYPAQITQEEDQLVRVLDNVYMLSAYPTSSADTVVVIPYMMPIENYSPKKDSKVNDNKEPKQIEFGPYKDLAAFSYKKLNVHYRNNSPFATFTFMKKDIEVSHWGNVAVEEKYEVRHTGAELKGSFSRYDYQKRVSPSSFNVLVGTFPKEAVDFYYRDEIGNISTSHVRRQRSDTLLELEPRFPLFGGWKTDFYIGYNSPAHGSLNVDTNTGRYVLDIQFGSSFHLTATEQAVVRVILPEGATNIKWTTPFPVDDVEHGVFQTYLDTVGRPTLTLTKNLAYSAHNTNFQVSYDFTGAGIYREPIMLITVFLVFFLLMVVSMRIELSVSADKKTTKIE